MAESRTIVSTETSLPTGRTVVVDTVVAKIVGIAAREVPGVFALGSGAARVLGNLREAIGAKDLAQGVKVEVGETEVAADLVITVSYPERLQEVAEAVRVAVTLAVTEIVGMQVAEINVTVGDVHIPGEDDDDVEESRVL